MIAAPGATALGDVSIPNPLEAIRRELGWLTGEAVRRLYALALKAGELMRTARTQAERDAALAFARRVSELTMAHDRVVRALRAVRILPAAGGDVSGLGAIPLVAAGAGATAVALAALAVIAWMRRSVSGAEALARELEAGRITAEQFVEGIRSLPAPPPEAGGIGGAVAGPVRLAAYAALAWLAYPVVRDALARARTRRAG